MYIIIVEKDKDIPPLIERVARELFESVTCHIVSIVETDHTIVTTPPDMVFWAGDIHGGSTIPMLKAWAKAFPHAVHVAMSSAINQQQTDNGCTESLSKPFEIAQLRYLLNKYKN